MNQKWNIYRGSENSRLQKAPDPSLCPQLVRLRGRCLSHPVLSCSVAAALFLAPFLGSNTGPFCRCPSVREESCVDYRSAEVGRTSCLVQNHLRLIFRGGLKQQKHISSSYMCVGADRPALPHSSQYLSEVFRDCRSFVFWSELTESESWGFIGVWHNTFSFYHSASWLVLHFRSFINGLLTVFAAGGYTS